MTDFSLFIALLLLVSPVFCVPHLRHPRAARIGSNRTGGVYYYHYDDRICVNISKKYDVLFRIASRCLYEFQGDWSEYIYRRGTDRIYMKNACHDAQCRRDCFDGSFGNGECISGDRSSYVYGNLNRSFDPLRYYRYRYNSKNCDLRTLNVVNLVRARCERVYDLYDTPNNAQNRYWYAKRCSEDGRRQLQKWYFMNSDCEGDVIKREDLHPGCQAWPGQDPLSNFESCQELV